MKCKTLSGIMGIACILLSVGACDKARDSAGNVLDTASDESSATINNLREVFGVARKAPEKINSQPRYCYQTYQDVICYSRPIAGENYRLVGWQDNNGHAGYVLPDGKTYVGKTKIATVKKPEKETKETVVTTTTPANGKTPATSTTVTIQSRNVSTGLAASSTTVEAGTGKTITTTTTPAAAPKAPLKEIIFDPAELEPKQLVPDKVE